MTEQESEKPQDWESLAKRLIQAGQIGIRIEQSDGHRWIYEDPKADHCKFLFCPTNMVSETWLEKHYGSVRSALDLVDAKLVDRGGRSLEADFDKEFNYFDDLGVVFGDGIQ